MSSIMKRAVFFDCWDTLISFKSKTPSWNIACLREHAINSEQIDWDAVSAFSDSFFQRYFRSSNGYEISDEQFLKLIILNFHIQIDCPVSRCADEVFDHLDPHPVGRVMDFLSLLNSQGIYHAVLSNTIYSSEKTLSILDELLPGHGFSFFLGSAEVGVKKPNPTFFNTGLRMAQVRASDSIYIGDSFLADVQGANLSRFNNVIWLNSSEQDSTRFSDLPTYLSLNYEEVSSYQEVIDLFKEQRLWR